VDATLQLRGQGLSGNWKLIFPEDRVKISRVEAGGALTSLTSNVATSVVLSQTIPLKIEAIKISDAVKDVEVKATFTPANSNGTMEDKLLVTVLRIDLEIDSIDEKSEDTDGGWLLINDGYDEANSNSMGNPIWDNYPDSLNGERIAEDDQDLRDATLYLEGPANESVIAKWNLKFSSRIKVWMKSENQFLQLSSDADSQTVSLSKIIPLKLEGISKSETENDIEVELNAQIEPNTSEFRDKVRLTVYQNTLESQITEGSSNQEGSEEGVENGTTASVGIQQTQAPIVSAFKMDSGATLNGDILQPLSTTSLALDKLPPLIPTNSKARRAISVMLPRRYANVEVTWEVNGPGYIRGVAADSEFTRVIKQVAVGQRCTVIFKTVDSGPIWINVKVPNTGARTGKAPFLLWVSKPTYAVRITQLAEKDHQANHVPNDKYKRYGKAYPSELPSDSDKIKDQEKKKKVVLNRLFYCQEPEDQKIELRLTTTLKNSNSPALRKTKHGPYWWRMAGQEENADNAFTPHEWNVYPKKLNTDMNGVAYLEFWPKRVAWRNRVTPGALYSLSIGADTDGDGKPDENSWIPCSRPSFQVKHISQNQRAVQIRKMIWYTKGSLLGGRFTVTLLKIFMFGSSVTGTPYAVPSPTMYRIRANDPSLTHIAGAHFSGVNNLAKISKFTWPASSQVEHLLYYSYGFRQHIIDNVLKPHKQEILSFYQSGTSPSYHTFSWDIPDNVQVNWSVVKIGGILGNGADSDLSNSIGTVYIKNGKVRLQTVRQADGSLAASRIYVTGTIYDLTDYDYYGAVPSRVGASIQIGWEGTARPEGQIFYNEIPFKYTFSPKTDLYGFRQSITNNFLKTVLP
jgi:hypothetical protein